VVHYLRPYKALAAATIATALLSLGFSLVYPKLTQIVIDDVIAQKRGNLLGPVILGLIATFFLRDAFNSLRILLNNTFEQNVIYDMRRDLYGHLQRLPVSYFDKRASGDLMTRVAEDVNAVERVLIDGTEQGTVAVLSLLGVATIMFITNPLLALVALIPLPILIAGALWYTLTAHRRYRAQRTAASALNSLLMDNLQGIRQIKAFEREPHEDQRFSERADALRRGNLGIMRVWAVYSPAMAFAGALGTAFVLWFGGRQVLASEQTLGELVGFLFYLGLFYEPVARLHTLNQMLQAARAAGERVFDILDTQRERPLANLKVFPPKVRGEVEFRDVSFDYESNKPALRNLSLRAQPGEMVALVGPTGAGKTTLVNLLPGFYEPSGGTILIDGEDTRRFSLESLRAQISIVSQEAFLFNGSIRENIRYGRLEASEDELISAAKAANCHEFISRLPHGYDSRVGERGVRLSVGEKQRVSIARALLKNAPILILDEATASVDTATEKLIQEALERLMNNRTSFVIAHRLSTIRKAGQILVIKAGGIIERGTHEELLATGGLYSRLARIQGARFIEDGFEELSRSEK
jgi:ABC-type multidrug transport system fused ATPase/permease subunit